MLFNVKLNAGQFTELARQGRHINVVLAAGEIVARIRYKSGQVFTTKIVSGMAFETDTYDAVSFKSDKGQQCKVWLSDIPLTYSPDTKREVGSNSLVSSVGQVFSGVASELLPAEPGRNRITLSPVSDVYIGGVNLDTSNGVKIAAGQTFTLATQGAVYALETSGAFPESYTAAVTASDIANPVNNFDKSFYHFYQAANGRTWGSAAGVSVGSLHEYDSDQLPGAFVQKGNEVSFSGSEISTRKTVRYGDVLYFMTGTSTSAAVGSFDLSTGTFEAGASTAISSGQIGLDYNATAGRMVMMDGASNVYYSDDGGASWTTAATKPSVSDGLAKGIAVFADGSIYVNYSNNAYLSEDNGATWGAATTEGAPTGQCYPNCRRDPLNDELYVLGGAGNLLKSSDKGLNFVEVLSDYNFRAFDVYGGRLIAASPYRMATYDDNSGDVYIGPDVNPDFQSNTYFAGVNPTGTLYAQHDRNNQAGMCQLVTGQKVPINGLKVSIMSEVN